MKYESSITYHSKGMANVKVFTDKQMDKETDRQTDKWTNQKLYAPNLTIWGRKKLENDGRTDKQIHCHLYLLKLWDVCDGRKCCRKTLPAFFFLCS